MDTYGELKLFCSPSQTNLTTRRHFWANRSKAGGSGSRPLEMIGIHYSNPLPGLAGPGGPSGHPLGRLTLWPGPVLVVASGRCTRGGGRRYGIPFSDGSFSAFSAAISTLLDVLERPERVLFIYDVIFYILGLGWRQLTGWRQAET